MEDLLLRPSLEHRIDKAIDKMIKSKFRHYNRAGVPKGFRFKVV